MYLKSFALAALLGLSAAGGAAADTLRLGLAAEPYPPMFVVDSSGNWSGWEVDIGKAICAKMQAECEIVPTAWDALIPELTAKKIDMIIGSMSITEERLKTIDFSTPYYNTPAVLVAAKDAPDGTDPAALKGKTLGVQQATIHQAYAEKYFGDADIKVYQQQDEANQDLVSGRLDYIQADVLAMSDFVTTGAGKDCCRIIGEVKNDPAILGTGVGIGIRKGETELKARLDKAIGEILSDGTFDKLTKPVFGDLNIRPSGS